MYDVLHQYGLSDKEIAVYIALLKSRQTTANRLSEMTNIRRSTVYEVVESLKKKGIVTSCIKEKKFYFMAAPPKTLVSLLKEKERAIQQILPTLNQLAGSVQERQGAEIFEGITAIKQAVLEMLQYKEIFVYGGSTVGDEMFGSFTENFARKRLESKTTLRAVIGHTIPQHMMDSNIRRLTHVRRLSFFEKHNSVYFTYGDNVLCISLGAELVGVRIRSNILAQSQRELFSFFWKLAK